MKKLKRESEMARVVVTRPMVGICFMQVCAVKDATDGEILDVCNRENRSGTQQGWTEVCRNKKPDRFWGNTGPVRCKDDPNRLHFLVAC